MDNQNSLLTYLQVLIGKRLDNINLACEMMMFSFEDYAIHSQCLTRIIAKNDIFVTTMDYQSWDGENDKNNDEWYFVDKYKEQIVGGIVLSVNLNALNDLSLTLNNGITIELFVQNGYNHFDDEREQWRFFSCNENSKLACIVVFSKSVEITQS